MVKSHLNKGRFGAGVSGSPAGAVEEVAGGSAALGDTWHRQGLRLQPLLLWWVSFLTRD